MEERWLVPLDPPLTYIPFKYAGKVRVFVKLVWIEPYRDTINPVGRLHDEYLRYDRHSYHRDMLQYGGEEFLDQSFHYDREEDNLAYIENDDDRKIAQKALDDKKARHAKIQSLISAQLDVMVPEACFAKEPPAWLKKWVNLYYDSDNKPYDECEFRRRHIPAFTLPIIVAINYLIRLGIVAILLSVGMKNINYRPLWRILDTSTEDIWEDLDGSIFFPEWDKKLSDEKEFPPLRAIPLSFSPAALIGIAAGWYCIVRDPGTVLIRTGLSALAWSIGLTLVIAIFFAIVWTVLAIRDLGQKQTQRTTGAADQKAKKAVSETPWYLQEQAVAMLAGENRTLATRVADLPKEQRTIWLRFLDLKARICKPYAEE